MSSTFWISQPNILIDLKQPLLPNPNLNCETNINAITKIVILVSLLGMVLTESLNYAISGILTILLLIFIYYHSKKQEHYENLNIRNKCKLNINTTKPTSQNPLMNVLLPEINGNPNRSPAEKSFDLGTKQQINDQVKQTIISDTDLDPRLFKSLGEEVSLSQSMRQFNTNPSTTIPNDQDGFIKFCYGDMKSCKEDNSVCTGNIPTYNQLT